MLLRLQPPSSAILSSDGYLHRLLLGDRARVVRERSDKGQKG